MINYLKLSYNIYTDSNLTTIFGDGTSGSSNVHLNGIGNLQVTYVYGAAPLNQYITPDTYIDYLTVTISY